MKDGTGQLSGVSRSGFLRSVMTRVLAIFIIVSVIIASAVFLSFTAEIRKGILLDRHRQLTSVEQTISGRMEEISSIAYNIGNDPVFYFDPVDDRPDTGREMSQMLGRYLVSNGFIEHLAYCRAAEPDKIYIRTGERSLSEFLCSSLHIDAAAANAMVQNIHRENKTSVRLTEGGENAFFAYSYPLPQLAETPKAHVLILIRVKEVQPMLEPLLLNGNGMAAVFDADGNPIYSAGNLDDTLDLADFVRDGGSEENCKAPSGQQYVLQKVVSETNGWTYVSAMRYSDTLSGLANKQLATIVFILLLLLAAIVAMLASIITQYRPISKLAAQVADSRSGGAEEGVLDERALLSDTIATLQDDSAQKQKYETAFYQAEAASKAKSAFLSSMSHDIRTPMNAIIGMTAIARKHIGDQAYVDACLEKVQVSSDYLLDIINNVLDMSRIESGKIPIAEEPVAIPALIDSVVSLMTSGAEAKSQTLVVELGELRQTTVLGDNIHIVQVFVNILSNAVKFTPEGGKITIRVRQTESDDPKTGCYVFSFSDTGVGIPPDFIGQVFETFARADGPLAARTEGTGLGMAIAKRLVLLMGGDITCESTFGSGATFTVTLPMKYADDEADPLSALSGAHRGARGDGDVIDLTGRRILLVEDNAMNREIAGRIISETGAEIVEANDGQAAVDAFSAHPAGYFDLIFMDIQMPVMNGYEATAAIRAMERPDAATVPIYAMTANIFDEDVRQVRDAGMNGHIGKPYHPQTLYKALADALG